MEPYKVILPSKQQNQPSLQFHYNKPVAGTHNQQSQENISNPVAFYYEPDNPILANGAVGFDPFALLEKIEFPNDTSETLIRHSKLARLLAIMKAPLELASDPEKARHFLQQSGLYSTPSYSQQTFQQEEGRTSVTRPPRHRTPSMKRSRQHSMSLPPTDQLIPSGWNDDSTPSSFSEKNKSPSARRIYVAGEEDEDQDKIDEEGSLPSLGRRGPITRRASLAPPIVIPSVNNASISRRGSDKMSVMTSRRQSLIPTDLGSQQLPSSARPKNPVPTSTIPHSHSFKNSPSHGQIESIQRYHLARSAAAITIQALFRGWHLRQKYIMIMHHRLSVLTKVSRSTPPDLDSLPPVEDLSAQESLRNKYRIYCEIYERLFSQNTLDLTPPSQTTQEHPTPPSQPQTSPLLILPEYVEFCATKIQACFRMFSMRSAYSTFISLTEEDKLGLVGRDAWRRLLVGCEMGGMFFASLSGPDGTDGKTEGGRKKTKGKRKVWKSEAERKIDAVKVIQNAWRGFYNKRVFHFYKEMINFHARGDPKRLLRFINPKEASLLDPFLAIHVRFRLGVPPTASSLTNNGEQKSERRRGDFPPTIYYKIFVHERMVDLNAFSPRNYTQMHCKQPLPKQLFLKDEKTPISGKDRSKSTTSKEEAAGWYQRYENNDWRPVTESLFQELKDDSSSAIPGLNTSSLILGQAQIIQENPSKKPFHYSKLKRREEVVKERKQKRIEWLKQVYLNGVSGGAAQEHEKGTENAEQVKRQDGDLPALPAKKSQEDLKLDSIPKTFEHQASWIEKKIRDLEQDLDSGGLEDESLIKWTRALDFDAYCDEWLTTGVTGKTDDQTTYFLEEEGFLPDETSGYPNTHKQHRHHQQSEKILSNVAKFLSPQYDVRSRTSGVSPFEHMSDYTTGKIKELSHDAHIDVLSNVVEEKDDVDDVLVKHVLDHGRSMTIDAR